MSVIVKRLKSSSMEIYVKGAPEVMADICDKSSCASALHFFSWMSFINFCLVSPSGL
jgi:magnesium-transporting ATPase (P-type)